MLGRERRARSAREGGSGRLVLTDDVSHNRPGYRSLGCKGHHENRQRRAAERLAAAEQGLVLSRIRLDAHKGAPTGELATEQATAPLPTRDGMRCPRLRILPLE